jgi:hypothetical protein
VRVNIRNQRECVGEELGVKFVTVGVRESCGMWVGVESKKG